MHDCPQLLNIQLSRFSFDPKTGSERKICSQIALPSSLSLKKFFKPGGKKEKYEPHYDLFGFVSHIGLTIHGGHYVAYITDRYFAYADTCNFL